MLSLSDKLRSEVKRLKLRGSLIPEIFLAALKLVCLSLLSFWNYRTFFLLKQDEEGYSSIIDYSLRGSRLKLP